MENKNFFTGEGVKEVFKTLAEESIAHTNTMGWIPYKAMYEKRKPCADEKVFEDIFGWLVEDGLFEVKGDRCALTEKGLFWYHEVR